MRSEIKGFGTIAREILSEICEDPTYANPTYASLLYSQGEGRKKVHCNDVFEPRIFHYVKSGPGKVRYNGVYVVNGVPTL